MWKAHFNQDGDFILGEYIPDDKPLDDLSADDSVCPLCGGKTHIVGNVYDGSDCWFHECEDCNFQSDMFFE